MIAQARREYNASYSDKKYQDFLSDIAKRYRHTPEFRIAETPVFVDRGLKEKLFEACNQIAATIRHPDFNERTNRALEPHYTVPNEDAHSLFLQMDFGITRDEHGALHPQLIEVQGFPSLYFYQHIIAQAYRDYFNVPTRLNHLFGGITNEDYVELLRRVIVGPEDPVQVVLLEIEPDKQTTRIDFIATQEHLGIPVCCVSDLRKRGEKVYYVRGDGAQIEVRRIYNRVIFDELAERRDLKREFLFTEPCDVHWVGHPNWFYRISKYTLPLLDGPYVPECHFLDTLDEYPEDLSEYVVKPLFSFSGAGVVFDVTRDTLEAIVRPSKFLLQKKVHYTPVIEAPGEPVKCEIRMLMIWPYDEERPRIVNNLARLSKGKLIGVKYNKNKTWVGGSVAFFE